MIPFNNYAAIIIAKTHLIYFTKWIDPSELLVTYLREERGLKGAKVACGEGKCFT